MNKPTFLVSSPEQCDERFMVLRNPHQKKPVYGLRSKNNDNMKHNWVFYNQFQVQQSAVPKDAIVVKDFSRQFRQNYLCGSKVMYTKKVAKPEYDKIRNLTKGWKSYFIHHNGGRPYLVYVDPSSQKIRVYSIPSNVFIHDESDHDSANKWMYTNPVYQASVSRVWIGKSPKNKMTQYSGGFGRRFLGNSILIKTKKAKEYIFIGEKIYRFLTPNHIEHYVSPVGNSDVPYPFAIDHLGNAYLMIEKVILPAKSFDLENPYSTYYQNNKKLSKKMNHVKQIHIPE